MDIRKLPLELKEKANRESPEDERRIIEYTEHITNWLKKQPHINARIDPQWLAAFLRGSKYSLERTKEKLDLLYTIKTHMPQLFHNRNPYDPVIQEILDLGCCLPLPLTVRPDSARIAIIRCTLYDPKRCHLYDVLRTACMLLDVLLITDDRLNVSGVEVVVDLVGFQFEHLGHATPTLLKQGVMCFQDAYPLKIKSLHIINTLPIMETVISIFKGLLSSKLRDRIMFHSDINALFKYIPQRVFPMDYGGEGPSLVSIARECKAKVLENNDWFIEDAQHGVIESKRPEKKIKNIDLFGTNGSFKKLDFD